MLPLLNIYINQRARDALAKFKAVELDGDRLRDAAEMAEMVQLMGLMHDSLIDLLENIRLLEVMPSTAFTGLFEGIRESVTVLLEAQLDAADALKEARPELARPIDEYVKQATRTPGTPVSSV